MSKRDKFKKLIKAAREEGVTSPGFKIAFGDLKEEIEDSLSFSSGEAGAQTNGKKKNHKSRFGKRPKSDDQP